MEKSAYPARLSSRGGHLRKQWRTIVVLAAGGQVGGEIEEGAEGVPNTKGTKTKFWTPLIGITSSKFQNTPSRSEGVFLR
jgi:hypothetical protein